MLSDYTTSKPPPKVLELPGTNRCSLVGGEQEDWCHVPGRHDWNKNWASLQGPVLLVPSQFGWAGAMEGRGASGKEPSRLFLILIITFD